MWDYGYNEEATVNIRDSVPGVVKGQSKSGVYIELNIENDIEDHKEVVSAFGYWIGRLPIGTKVLCSIKKQAKEDKDILVSVDSVFYQDDMVMAA